MSVEELKEYLKPVFKLSMKERGNLFDMDLSKKGIRVEKFPYGMLGKLDETKGVIIPFQDSFRNQCGIAYITQLIKPEVKEA